MCELGNQIGVLVPSFIYLRYNLPEEKIRRQVSIDVCMVEEIYNLWKRGIKTIGCCCGHGGYKRNIGVEDDSIQDMIALGYIQVPKRKNIFESKEKLCGGK